MGTLGWREDDTPFRRCVFTINLFRTLTLTDAIGTEADVAIDAMAMDGDFIWAAAGSNAIQYHRGKEVSMFMFNSYLVIINCFRSNVSRIHLESN